MATQPSQVVGKKFSNAPQRCGCGHAKSIHSRMYANPKLGTPCNFPECRCKAFKLTLLKR